MDFLAEQQKLTVVLSGDMRRYDNQSKIAETMAAVARAKEIRFEATGLRDWDSTTAAVIYRLITREIKPKTKVITESLPKDLQRLLALALAVDRKPAQPTTNKGGLLERLGGWGLEIGGGVKKALAFMKDAGMSLVRFFCGRAVMRRVDFEFALEDCGYKAIGIVSLVSFMVGLILAFVGALQLKMFGAQIYIASLVTIGMIRIMGAIMAGIIIAGRTGAAYAATIGTMQVNEEVDALKTFGFSVSDFLVLPRLLSLMITMPFLTMLADIMGMIGGAFVAVLILDISAPLYWQYSVSAFGLNNFLVGIFHGFVYGLIIAGCGCYYGVNCGRNADSVGVATTRAVVASIVIMIVVTGILTLIFEAFGI